ncbi:MAG: BON domain-containing protein [Chloroflexi bacterium]|nr:BON domain-containing protein [Chloroflexota bacterium]
MSADARELRHARADDERLAEAVAERLEAYEPLRASGARIAVSVEQSVVHLRGLVRGATQPAEAARVAAGVPGVRAVQTGGLRTDEQIAVDVAAALAQDPETARALLRVQVALGVVLLRGGVADPHVVERAVACCMDVPGVQRVRSEAQVVRAAPRAGTG